MKDEVFEICGALALAESLLIGLGRPGDAARMGSLFEVVEGRLVDERLTTPAGTAYGVVGDGSGS